ncbi:ZIP family metal transporter [Thiohalobacter thiocyanaticus]|uniref:ZIP family metal transporter n=1 Tax=Thiohalobacter thiocyanaticus TaxID=585455 RepID=A0A426QLB6_9GAMM|nr:ZIP family metal transporter [Thiohalobacter thiocyanaticus]RRQ22539.1 ZIP family metal transporter [Thiohalobacter thiocyanaticus]
MPLLSWILLFCLLGGALSVIAAGAYLLFPERVRTALLPHLVSFAIGALLGAAFLALLPHALATPGIDDYHVISATVLLGVLGFFLLEKLVLWRHCHEAHCEVHTADEPENHDHNPAAGTLILIGDAVHNLVDGVLIGAAFLTDFHLGVVTSLAVAAHEIPQEVGDFAILLNSGYTRVRAFVFNIISSLATLVGGLIAYLSLQQAEAALPYVLAIAASSFIYVAVADLIPGLHKRVHGAATAQQMALIAAGVLVIYAAHTTLH